MYRMLFKKTGNAVWVSHLDLMRIFQRAFKRAGLPLIHTQGFNPRPSVSIALPLSVGVSSVCELLDFDLDGEVVDCEEIKTRLNAALIDGVQVTAVYTGGRKLRELSLLSCNVTLEYDDGVPEGCVAAIDGLFAQENLIVPKKTKSGMQDQNIISMIRRIDIEETANTVTLNALVCCQNPSLNPQQLVSAISIHMPQYTPDFAKCIRLELYDDKENIFR